MITMVQIYNGGVLPYLNDVIPDKDENVFSYNTRNKTVILYFIPRRRLVLFKTFDKTMEFIKGRIKSSHLNKLISKKYICRNTKSNPSSCLR